MRRTALLALPLAVAAAVGWLLLRSDVDAGSAGRVDAPTVDAAPRAVALPERGEDVSAALPVATDGAVEALGSARGGASSRPTLELEVVHADGAPAVRPNLALARADRAMSVVRWADGDADGRATLEGFDTPAVLWVSGPCWPPQSHRLASGAGRHRVVLEQGAEVSGLVTVRGRTPDVPVELRLGTFPDSGAPRGMRHTFSTDATGRFRQVGLPDGWRAPVKYTSPPWVWSKPSDWPVVVAPESGVRLDLVPMPEVRGRVVHVDGRPAAKASVRYQWTREGAGSWDSVRAGPGGRFSIRFPPGGPLDALDLDVSSREGDERAVVTLVGPAIDPVEGAELPDIVLGEPAHLAIRVTDPHGRPVQDAVVVPAGPDGRAAGTVRSSPTRDSGDTVLRDPRPLADALLVVAERFRPAVVPLAAGDGRDAPVEVGLEPCASVRVVAPAPTVEGAIRPVRVELRAAHELFGLGLGSVDERLAERRVADGGVYRGRPAGGARLLDASCLVPGHAFTVCSLDQWDFVIESREEPPLAPGEWRVVTMREPVVPRELVLEVRTPDGSRLETFDATLRGPGGVEATKRRIPWGDGPARLRFPGLGVDTVDIEVLAKGHAPWRAEGVVVPRDRTPVVVVLESGRDVLLEVVDAAGRHVRPHRVDVTDARGAPLERCAFRPRGVVLRALPPETVRIEVEVYKRTHVLHHDARERTARLVLDDAGAAMLRWDPGLELPDGSWVVLSGEDGRSGTVNLEAAARTAGRRLVPGLPPGDWRAQLHAGRARGPWVEFTVEDGGLVDLRLDG